MLYIDRIHTSVRIQHDTGIMSITYAHTRKYTFHITSYMLVSVVVIVDVVCYAGVAVDCISVVGVVG